MNPIEIMDEIERASRPTFLMTAMRVGLQGSEQWQSLRTAIEAQAEELAQKEVRVKHLQAQVKGLEFHISTRPSLAAIKAAVLLEAAAGTADSTIELYLTDEADRIEREAKES